MNGVTLAELVRVAVLLAVALGLLVPVLKYSRRVLHTHAIYSGTLTVFVLAASVVVQSTAGRGVASEGLQLVAAASMLGTCWLFAREHVETGGEEPVDVQLAAEGGGFETAERNVDAAGLEVDDEF